MKLLGGLKGRAMQAAQKNFVEIAYCIYRFGYNQARKKILTSNSERELPWDFREFCKNIKQAHLEGKELWKNHDGRNTEGAAEEKSA